MGKWMMTLDKEKDYADIMKVIDLMEGHIFENFCAELLEKNGFRDVTVTRGSGDYGVDITARYHNRIYGIQCKRYAKTVGINAVRDALGGYDYYNCDIVAVLTNNTFTPQAVTQANISGVKLWDRKSLIDFIDNCENHEFINKFIGNTNFSVDKADASKVLIVDKNEIDDILREKNIPQVNAAQEPNEKRSLDSNMAPKSKNKHKSIQNKKKYKFGLLIIIFIIIYIFLKHQKPTSSENMITEGNTLSFQDFDKEPTSSNNMITEDNTLSFKNFENNLSVEDILTTENHPKYMDSIVDAYKAWGNLETGMTMYNYPYYEYRQNDSIVVSMEDRFDNGKITKLLLRLNSSSKTYSLADALLIVEDYFPAEENAQYYNFVESYYIQDIKNPEEHEKRYVIHYQLNDEAHQLRYEDKIDCVYNMYIYIWTDSNDTTIISSISFDNDFPNTLFASSLKLNEKEKVIWDYVLEQ